MGDSKHVSIVLNNDEQHKRWIAYADENNFSGVSHMIRVYVENGMKGEQQQFSKAMQPTKNVMDASYSLIELLNEKMDFMNMKLDNNNEDQSEVIKEAKVILRLLTDGEKSLAEIEARWKRNKEVVTKALVLIYQLGLIGTWRDKTSNTAYTTGG